jgi:CO/xanthine dehydrogenase FAD-binding subunit
LRSQLQRITLEAPGELEAALRLLANEPGAWRPFAGGTDLMVLLEAGTLPAGKYLSIWGLSDLRGITSTRQEVSIGAATTYTDIRSHPLLQAEFPLLCAAARQTGGVATQNRGTLGGNIANASPAADSPPALLVYDSSVELCSVRGVRRVPYDRFHSGYKVMDLAPDEIIQRIILPRRDRSWRQSYRKIGTREAQAIAKVCFAAAVELDGPVIHDVRIAFGSVAPTVVRAAHAEAALRGRTLDTDLPGLASRALALDIAPIDDGRSTAWYRTRVAQNLLIQFLTELRSERSH